MHKLILASAVYLFDKYQISCSDPFITHDISITMLLIIHYWFVRYCSHIWYTTRCAFMYWGEVMAQFIRFWYLTHMEAAEAQTSLHQCVVSSEPSLLAHTNQEHRWMGPVAQSVASQTADAWVWSWYSPILSLNFCGHSPPSADSRRVVVSYKQKYVHQVLVHSLVKLAQEQKCG